MTKWLHETRDEKKISLKRTKSSPNHRHHHLVKIQVATKNEILSPLCSPIKTSLLATIEVMGPNQIDMDEFSISRSTTPDIVCTVKYGKTRRFSLPARISARLVLFWRAKRIANHLFNCHGFTEFMMMDTSNDDDDDDAPAWKYYDDDFVTRSIESKSVRAFRSCRELARGAHIIMVNDNNKQIVEHSSIYIGGGLFLSKYGGAKIGIDTLHGLKRCYSDATRLFFKRGVDSPVNPYDTQLLILKKN